MLRAPSRWRRGSRTFVASGWGCGRLKSGSEVILRGIAEILDQEFAWADVFHVTKHSASLPPKPEVLEALHRHADVVIAGVGD